MKALVGMLQRGYCSGRSGGHDVLRCVFESETLTRTTWWERHLQWKVVVVASWKHVQETRKRLR